jgi:hypothetical protein
MRWIGTLERLDEVVKPVHRHPRAVRAALARGALAGGGGLDEVHAGQALPHLVDDAAVGGDDVFGRAQPLRGLDDPGGGAHGVRHLDHARGRLGVHQDLRLRMQELQLLQLLGLELIVHHAGGVPHQHVRPGHLLDVGAQVLVGRPQDLAALGVQVAHDLLRDGGGDHPVGASLHRRARVRVDDHHPVRMLAAELRERLDRGGEVERALGGEVGHQHPLLGIQDLGGLAHEAHARDHDGLRGVLVPEARHLERVRYRSAACLRKILQVRMDVVVGDQHRIALAEQLFGALQEGRLFRGRDQARGLGGGDAYVAVEALEADLDGSRGGHGVHSKAGVRDTICSV